MKPDSDLSRQLEKLQRERDAYAKALADANAAFMEKVKEFSILKRHSAMVTWNLDKKRICLGLLEIIIDELDVENCSLWLVEPNRETLRLTAAGGQEDDELKYFEDDDQGARRLALGEGVAGWVALHGRSLLIDDVSQSPHFVTLADGDPPPITSMLCLPIKGQADVLGVLNLSHPDIGVFSQENERFLALITGQAALAFSNYFLFRESRDFSKKLERLVTERTEDLRRSQERFDVAVGSGEVAVWDWRIKSDQIYISPNTKTLLGFAENAFPTMTECLSRVHPDDRERLKRAFDDHLRGRTPQYQEELRFVDREGDVYWFFVRGRLMREAERITRMIGSSVNISSVKRAEERLLYEAHHDKLTSLPNRTLFLDWVLQGLDRAAEEPDYSFAVLLFDLDRFQVINDALGHDKGDQLIQGMSRRGLSFVERPGVASRNPRFARLGGDEFALFLDAIDDEDTADAIAEDLQTFLSEPFLIQHHQIVATVSMGIVLSVMGYDHPEDMMRDADAAMNQAKSQGKARHQVFQRTIHHKALSRLMLENDLRQAVADPDQIEVFYQPIVALSHGGIAGFEALARWRHPERGLVSPNEFIPLAEETGLIATLGRTVLEKACATIAEWRARFADHLYLSVNLSPSQLLRLDIVDEVTGALARHQLSSEALHLELTESAMVQNYEMVRDCMEQLRRFKLKLLLDDFGTGYSSLSYLHRFPIDTLKIDSSFVQAMHQTAQNEAIVGAIKLLADHLNLTVVAEGIETEEQLRRLHELSCQYGQGYYFAKPAPKKEAEALIRDQRIWTLPN